MSLPGDFSAAVAAWLAGHPVSASRREASAALSATYRSGGSSRAIDLASYLVARLPATYAAVSRVLAELAAQRPEFSPESLLDAGSGPGTASWAAAAVWPGLQRITFLDNAPAFLKLAVELASHGGPALSRAEARAGSMETAGQGQSADLVIAAYALAELPLQQVATVALELWRASAQVLVLVEPGTPQGFARIRAAREALLGKGAVPVAPCPQGGACPIAGEDWCHFSVRLARSRAHMHAKGATVPFEDEKFAYLILARDGPPTGGARIIAPPQHAKPGSRFRLCSDGHIAERLVAKREGDLYKQSRKLDWGDLMPPATQKEEKNMSRKQISSGSKFEAEIGYSRAIVDGDWIWVSGTTGFNYETMTISDDVAEQADQTLRNIKAAMEKAGFALEDVVRVTYIFPNGADFEPCWPVFRKYFGETRPACTAVVAQLIDSRMKIEIEVTGKKR